MPVTRRTFVGAAALAAVVELAYKEQLKVRHELAPHTDACIHCGIPATALGYGLTHEWCFARWQKEQAKA